MHLLLCRLGFRTPSNRTVLRRSVRPFPVSAEITQMFFPQPLIVLQSMWEQKVLSKFCLLPDPHQMEGRGSVRMPELPQLPGKPDKGPLLEPVPPPC